MTTRTWTSRSTTFLAGPALLAVLAILASTPSIQHSNTSPRLVGLAAVAVAVSGGVINHGLSIIRGIDPATIDHVGLADASRTAGRIVDHERDRMGPMRLVLPPPTA